MPLSRSQRRGAGAAGIAAAVLSLSVAAVAAPSLASASPATHGMHRVSHLSAPISASGAHAARATARTTATWPVGSRTATLTDHGSTPSTAPAAQQISSAAVGQYRAASSITAKVILDDVPTAETAADLVIAFGTVSSDGTSCENAQGIQIPDTGTNQTGLTYDGATISVTTSNPAVKNAAWNCSFVVTVPSGAPDTSMAYDAVSGPLTDHIQKAVLGIGATGAKLRDGKFSKVKVTIANSSQTIATAPNVQLTWKPFGLKIKGSHSVGSIAPGAKKVVTLLVEPTARKGRLKLTATSQDVSKSINLKVTPTS